MKSNRFLALFGAMTLGICAGYVLYGSDWLRDKSNQKVEQVEPEIVISEKETFEIYGRNVIYQDFYDIDFEPSEDIHEVPDDLAWKLLSSVSKPRIDNPVKFETLVLQTFDELGMTEDDIVNMDPAMAIVMSSVVAGNRIRYASVDIGDDEEGRKFVEEYGTDLRGVDFYFEKGLGDCDKYSRITWAVFDIIKEHNPNLDNVYLAEELSGFMHSHAWNTIVYLKEDSIIVSHVDPTLMDNYGSFEGIVGEHVNENLFLPEFYADLLDAETAFILYKELDGSEEIDDLEQMWVDLRLEYYEEIFNQTER